MPEIFALLDYSMAPTVLIRSALMIYKSRGCLLLMANSVVVYSLVLFFLRDLDVYQWFVLAATMVILAIAPYLIIFSALKSLSREVEEGNLETLYRDRELVTMRTKLSSLAHLDNLTGCYNERYFLDVLSESIAMSERGGYVFTLLILRYDQFDYILNKQGLSQGNEALKFYVEVINKILREVDTIARLGADKFGLILSDSSENDSVLVFDRIVREISRLQLTEGQDTIATNTGGMTSYFRGEAPEAMLGYANLALHSAMDQGEGGLIIFDYESTKELTKE